MIISIGYRVKSQNGLDKTQKIIPIITKANPTKEELFNLL